MSVKDVVDSQIRTARICRQRHPIMSEVDWLVGGIIFTLKHSMEVMKDPNSFAKTAHEYLNELQSIGNHEAAEKVSGWLVTQAIAA